MKKIISVLATAAVAMTMVMTSCSYNNETEITTTTYDAYAKKEKEVVRNYDKDGKQIPRKEKQTWITVESTQQWSGPQFDCGADWATVEIEFDAGAENFQIVYISDKKNAAITAYEAWFSAYSGNVDKATQKITIDVADATAKVKATDSGVTKVAKFQIQNTTAGAASTNVTKLIAKKADGSVAKTLTKDDLSMGYGGKVGSKTVEVEVLD